MRSATWLVTLSTLHRSNLYTVYIAVLFLNTALSLVVAGVALRLRRRSGALPLGLTMLAIAEWSLTLAFEFTATDISTKILWSKFQYLGITSAPALLLIFALTFSGREKWLQHRYMIPLWVFPVVTAILAWTNHWHHLIWTSFTPVPNSNLLLYGHGPAFWAFVGYVYLALMASSLLIFRMAHQLQHIYRRQATVLLISLVPPWLVNVLYVFDLGPFPGWDLTPVGFAITGLLVTWSFVRLQLLDLVPVARDTVIESMQDAMLVLDVQNRVVDLNPAAQRLMGLRADSAIGQPVASTLSYWPQLREHLQTISPTKVEVDTDGEGAVEVRISPLYHKNGRLIGRAVTLHDITERRHNQRLLQLAHDDLERRVEERTRELAEANRRLQELDHLKSKFVTDMTHELRTPVTNIYLYLKLMERQPAKKTQYLAVVQKQSQRLMNLVQDILDLTHLDIEDQEITFSTVDLNEILEEIVQTYECQAQCRGLQLIFDADPKLPPVKGNRKLLNQLVTQLVDNGVNYTPAGQVHLSVRLARHGVNGTEARQIYLEVKDTGRGIAPRDLPHLFERFYRGQGVGSSVIPGTGLGLALVKEILDLHGGWSEVESQEGQGSCFRIWLPVAESTPGPRQQR